VGECWLTRYFLCGYNSPTRGKGMISVGVRQLKNGLRGYLRLVEKGESLLVTIRNRTVAILKKPDRVNELWR